MKCIICLLIIAVFCASCSTHMITEDIETFTDALQPNLMTSPTPDNTMVKEDLEVPKDSEALEQASISLEDKIWAIIHKDRITVEDSNFIIDNLPKIDFSQYDMINQDAVELLSWLDLSDYSTDIKLNVLIQIKGLDGAFAEKYSAIIGEIFLQDKLSFIRCFSDKETNTATTHIASSVAYYCSYFDVQAVLDDLIYIIATESFNVDEQSMADELLSALNKYNYLGK